MSQRRHVEALTEAEDEFLLPLLSGSDGEDEDDEHEEPEDGDDDAQGGDDGDEDGDGEDEESLDDLKQQLKDALSKSADFERRMRMADRTAAKYRTENETLKSGKTQAEANGQQSLEDQVKDLKAQLADRRSGDTRATIRDEFLSLDGYDWHNRNVAFGLLDISDVDVDDRGRVDREALKDRVDQLAQENPYLVKQAEKKGKDERPKPERPSGSQPGTHRRDRKQTDRAKLVGKYPQLGGRS